MVSPELLNLCIGTWIAERLFPKGTTCGNLPVIDSVSIILI